MLTRRERDTVAQDLSSEIGLPHPTFNAGTVRQRLTLTSGRFAMMITAWASSSCLGCPPSTARLVSPFLALCAVTEAWTDRSGAVRVLALNVCDR
jgi:hypothetical protein